jgi:hypothetical protein
MTTEEIADRIRNCVRITRAESSPWDTRIEARLEIGRVQAWDTGKMPADAEEMMVRRVAEALREVLGMK